MSAKRERPKFTEILTSSWSFHSTSCACIGNDFKIHFIGSEKEDSESNAISRSQKATVISWCPHKDVLASGWSDGNVGIWKNEKNFTTSFEKKHSISHLEWHPTLDVFATVNNQSEVSFWSMKEDSIELISTKSLEYKIEQLIFSPREEKLEVYVLTDEGELYKFTNGEESTTLVITLPRPVHHVSLSFDGNTIRTISGDNVFTVYTKKDKKIHKKTQIKLASGEGIIFTTFDDETICYVIGDTIHILGIDGSNEFEVRPKEGDKISGIMYYSGTNEFTCMTEQGRVLLWKIDAKKKSVSLLRFLESTHHANRVIWSPFVKSAISLADDKTFSISHIPAIRSVVSKNIVAVQIDTKSIAISGSLRKRFNFNIDKMSASANNLLVISKGMAHVMAMKYGSLTQLSEFNVAGICTEILGDTVYAVNGSKLDVHNKQGEVRASIDLETKSSIVKTCINGRFLCLLSSSLQIFLFDVSKRTPVLLSTSQIEAPKETYRVDNISISRGGYCVSMGYEIMDKGHWIRSPSVLLHSPKLHKTVPMKVEEGAPIAQLWDTVSERILCLQTSSTISPVFVTNELEVLPLKSRPATTDRVMFKVEAPRVFVCITGTRSQVTADSSVTSLLIPQLLQIDGLDGQTRRILINLLFAITNGDTVTAESIVNSIKEEFQARPAIRLLISIGEKDLAATCEKVLTKETEEQSVNKLSFLDNITSTSYDNAAEICSSSDKMTIRAASYVRGLLSEAEGKTSEAIKEYAASGPNGAEILRLALHKGDISVIFRAANDGNSDPQLHMWLGRYYEAKQQYETALTHYNLCGETRESLRLQCLMGKWQEASKRVSDTGVRGTMCALARLITERIPSLETEEEKESAKKEVLNLYKRAKQSAAAFQFAFENGMKSEILALSLGAPHALLARAAKKYEANGELRIAVLLWHRAGRVNKAITLCLDNELLGALEEIMDNITDKSDHEVLKRCAVFFADKEKWDKCAHFYALSHNFSAASRIADEHDITLSENLLESLSAEEDEIEAKLIAELCEQQEAYHIAAKIWYRLGDHISSMRNIIKGDDIDKVIKCANKLKRKEAFIMTGDYLASKSPREGEKLFTTAMQFYQRAGSYDRISQFLERSAQVEIDDYQDYERALDLLRRAHQTMAKTEMTREREAIVMSQLQKIRWIEMYIEATACVQTDPARMQCICNELLQSPGIESCLRLEDVYILLVRYFINQNNFVQAHRILENMRMNGVDIKWFLDEDQLIRIYRIAGHNYIDEVPDEEIEQVDDIPDDVVEPVEDDF